MAWHVLRMVFPGVLLQPGQRGAAAVQEVATVLKHAGRGLATGCHAPCECRSAEVVANGEAGSVEAALANAATSR